LSARVSTRIRSTRASSASALQSGVLALTAGLLCAFVTSGCATADVGIKAAEASIQVDLLILATDRATADELQARLQRVPNLPAAQTGRGTWSRGSLTGVRDGSVYSIVVGQVDAQDGMTTKSIMRAAAMAWRPRYVLVLGTAPAVAYDQPLGAVGLVDLICSFDLDRYEEMQDSGRCHRADGGLFTAALSITDEWKAGSEHESSRAGCAPPRVLKMTTLSGQREFGPGFVETATALAEGLHRGLIIEREGILVAKAVARERHETRRPIGLLMIRGVSEVRRPEGEPQTKSGAGEREHGRIHSTCAARDTVDFAVDLIRRRWPVSSYSQTP
jgi:hypothetical protein